MQSSPSTIAPLLLRNLLTSIFIHADKLLLSLSHKYKLLQLLRCLLASTFLFFLSLLPSLFSSFTPSNEPHNFPLKSTNDDKNSASVNRGSSGVSRALSQLLMIMNDIPVSSRKYEVVRSLAEKLIDENLSDSTNGALMREVNSTVLSAAFARSLSQLEEAVAEQGRGSGDGDVADGPVARENFSSFIYSRPILSRLVMGVKFLGREAWRLARLSSEMSRSAEKLAAELLWLAQKMAASFCGDEAVYRWASASKLARLALVAEPRLQGSLVKVSAFLIKQAKEMGKQEVGEGEEDVSKQDPSFALEVRQTKMKMLMSWLPLLCCANNGTDAPTLSMGERAELETILDEIISTLGEEDEQEWVLSLWLHHFTYCPASDWPNLRSSYTRWYSASRARLVLSASASSAD